MRATDFPSDFRPSRVHIIGPCRATGKLLCSRVGQLVQHGRSRFSINLRHLVGGSVKKNWGFVNLLFWKFGEKEGRGFTRRGREVKKVAGVAALHGYKGGCSQKYGVKKMSNKRG